MSAESTPPAWDVLSRSINAATALVLRRPWLVLAVAGALCAACCWYASAEMKFFTNRLHLLNPKSEFNQRWLAYIEEFGDEDDVVVVVRGADEAQVTPLLDAVAAEIAKEPGHFQNVLHRVDLDAIKAKGLYYLPPADLQRIEGFLARLGPILNNDWSPLNVENFLGGLAWQVSEARRGGVPLPLTELNTLAASLVQALSDAPSYRSPLHTAGLSAGPSDLADRSPYLLFDGGRLGIVLLHFAKQENSFTAGAASVDLLRSILTKLQTSAPAGVEFGLTGLPIMENDEMRSSSDTMTLATILSTLGVMLLFWAGFGGWKHMLLAITSLLVGMIWSFGYLTLFVGHLNILTVSFAVILIGLGIDFNVHYAAKYLALRSRGVGRAAALRQTASDIGPGVLTGALTTAAAFYVAGFSEFTGIAELGVIAGGGVLLCCVAALVIFPALVQVFDAAGAMKVTEPLPIGHWLLPLLRREKTVAAVFAVATLVGGYGLTKLWYDHNLLNLQPEGLESVKWEHTLLQESNQSAWYALSIADDPAELLARKEKFLALPTVHRVEELVSLVPADVAVKQSTVTRLSEAVSGLRNETSLIPLPSPQRVLMLLGQLKLALTGVPATGELVQRLTALESSVAGLSLDAYYRRIDSFQQQLARDVLTQLTQLRSVSSAAPPAISDLPASLVHRFVGKQGKHLLKIYAQGDIWDMANLEKFVADVRRVDPEATGKPLQTYEASRQMLAGYQTSALWAFGVIAVLLFLDFRSVSSTFWSLLPLLMGTIQTFGLLGLLGVPINPANIIALPVVLGVGVDHGVHVVHDFRRRKGRYRLSNSTANSILLCSLTTIVGFGSLMIADHNGVESLGRVMTIGVVACLLNSSIMLPAVLSWVTRREADVSEDAEVDEEAAELIAAQSAVVVPVAPASVASASSPTTASAELPADEAMIRPFLRASRSAATVVDDAAPTRSSTMHSASDETPRRELRIDGAHARPVRRPHFRNVA